ncbi:arylsulfatase [Ideonella livida]|uniref:Arylsulfatase n=1 Tax=Ideonella livida TaxID=2707176 RepID=A0A7C9PH27_9BURK|nr:arylsulfatase [Ideonella livida]NDY91797.1 arylsulfatase [Ideonella livida]
MATPAAMATAVASRPNLLLIVADDLGYSDLGAFGSEIPTPNLDALASQGRLLTQHYAAPTCSPTRAMLMSGTDHHQAGLGTMAELLPAMPGLRGRPGYEGYLNDRVQWLPELLRQAGYRTVMAGKWHLGRTPETGPVARGFEHAFTLLEGGGSHFSPVPGQPIEADRVTFTEDGRPAQLPPGFYSSDGFTDKLLAYLQEGTPPAGASRPFFAYLAFTAPHWPLHAPDADIARFAGWYDEGFEVIRERRLARQRALGLLTESEVPHPGLTGSKDYPRWAQLTPAQQREQARKMEVYAAMVHNLDRNVGRVVDYLKRTGQYDNTLIVFQSDNGAEASPSFFPDNAHTDNRLENLGRPRSNMGYGVRWAEVSSTPLRLFKGYAAEGGLRVPTIVRLPGQTTGLRPWNAPTHVTDVAPTLLAAAGVAPAASRGGQALLPMSGHDLRADLALPAPGPAQAERMLAGELFGGRYVREGRWKLTSTGKPFADNRWELYDLQADPNETQDLATRHPEVVARLADQWEDYARRTGATDQQPPRMPDVRFGASGWGVMRPASAAGGAHGQ